MLVKKGVSFCDNFIFAIIFLFTLSFLFVFPAESEARSGKFNILVKVNGEKDAIGNVSVNVTGATSDGAVTDKSKANGWVTFSKLESDSYTITPEKEGFFFTPSTLKIAITEDSKKRTITTFLATPGKPSEDGLKVPFENEWAGSAHADITAEAFNHWNEEDPQEIPVTCARCHSTPGNIDYLGADGSAPQVVDNPAPVGTVITCEVCHNDVARELDSVTFPSGVTITGLGHEAICMTCHQGRSSVDTVNSAIEAAAVKDDDTVSEKLGFINIHYFAAAATLYGKFAKGGYQYDGKAYDGRLDHVENVKVCIDCHNPHSLKIKVEVCATCHENVKEQDDVFNIRMNGSLVDYDGDGNMTEGIFFEIETMRERLLLIMQAYAFEKLGTPIVYDSHTYPYFFNDTNGNGKTDTNEVDFANSYKTWSPRLLKAAYNYQVSLKDPGAFAHGGKYVIELLYDSMEDVNSALTTVVAMAGMSRTDEAHFNGSSEAFRHWDEAGEVPNSCARCHGGGGFAVFLKNGTNIAAPVANGMLCSTCHDDLTSFSRRSVDVVTFPSGLRATLEDDSNLCMTCHQGRSSKSTVDDAIAASAGPYSFINIHYYPVGAVLFGSEVEGGYEFEGKVYSGRNTFDSHFDTYTTCVQCHMGTKGAAENASHNLTRPNPANCVVCHGKDVSQSNPGTDAALFKFREIRPEGLKDLDGDGVVTESIRSEVAGLEEALYKAIQKYAVTLGSPIIYDAHSYPYFFIDTDGNGEVDTGEVSFANKYVLFDANLLKAAYNYQTSQKEPGAYIHNSEYVSQLLVDSIGALGGDVSAYTWR